MNRLIEMGFNHIHKWSSLDIPEEYKDELLSEMLAININQEKFLSHILLLLALVLIFFDSTAKSNSHSFLYNL